MECLNLPGTRADVTFDTNQGDTPVDPADKLVGSLLTNLPQPTRYGYTFAGWADPRGTVVRSIVVPEGGTTLTARWTPNTYTLTLNGNGGDVNGQSSAAQTITFDAPYGQLPAARQTGFRFDGWWTDPVGGDPVTADTVLTDAESKTVYAHWKDLLRLDEGNGGSLFNVIMRTETYDRNTTYTLNDLTYSQIPGLVDAEGNSIPTDGFNFELKPKIAAGPSDGTAHDAGTYILEITRNTDGTYASYTETHDILVINKADWLTVFGTGVFQVDCSGKFNGSHQTTNGEVTARVSLTTSDLDLEQSVMDAMQFKVYGYRLVNEGGSANLGQTLKINSSQQHANGDKWREITITVEFPSGATSKNYNLPTSVQVYDDKVSIK